MRFVQVGEEWINADQVERIRESTGRAPVGSTITLASGAVIESGWSVTRAIRKLSGRSAYAPGVDYDYAAEIAALSKRAGETSAALKHLIDKFDDIRARNAANTQEAIDQSLSELMRLFRHGRP